MNAYRVETIILEDGKVLLQGLPFRAGETVEVIVLECANMQQKAQTSKPGANDAANSGDREYLEGVAGLMSEWESEADERAYADL